MISNRRWLRLFRQNAPLLVIALFEHEVVYLVRRGTRTIKAGVLPLPHDVIQNQRLIAPEQLISRLKAEIDIARLDVAVVLPTTLVHVQYITLPTGLDIEERDYQVTRHISQTVGLSMSEVFYDFTQHNENETMLAVARQTEVAQYSAAFAKTDWHLKWVCPEQQVWAGIHHHESPQSQPQIPTQFVCQVEYDRLQMWWPDKKGHRQHQARHFDPNALSQAGFLYRAPHQAGSQKHLQLPTNFAVNEIENAAKQWLDKDLPKMTQMLCTGLGLDWTQAQSSLQTRLGLSVRPVGTPTEGSTNADLQARLGTVWHLSQQIYLSSPLLNLWPNQKKQPQKADFIQETVLAGLFTSLVLSCSYGALWYQQNKTDAINHALEAELVSINAATSTTPIKDGQPVIEEAARLGQITAWKIRSANHLDWMLALNDLSNQSVQFTDARQENDNVVITGNANSPQSVAALLEQLNPRVAASHHVRLNQISSKTAQTQQYWQFSIELINKKQKISTPTNQGNPDEPK
ncbi:hypothetical protein GCM10009007_09930 [Formosimonas limnophila]|uniref:Uncharacterized protein n=1 Tax=Formosimonas limnophila TaxID=1384487 RepID=A0A8J3G0J6_9BURK|nr:PilN domain-containing protein [Formosimonas limnophila]GHA71077.1 hypothetical protein GCM10009007_09930 [Formosimonas limnophila]